MSSINQARWDKRWLGLARHYATWSIDPSTGVGAVIARGKEQISQGYNGLPAGIADTDERLNNRDLRLALTIHAEHNAILRAGAERCRDATLYVWPFQPCHRCAVDIIQAGISRVVTTVPDMALWERWKDSLDLSLALLEEAGVTVDVLLHDA